MEEAVDWLMALRDRGEVGFLDLPDENISHILSLAKKKRSIADQLVLVGIGGSSLGAECAAEALGVSDRLVVLDNVDPEKFARSLKKVEPERVCCNVISKSGSTTETIVNFSALLSWLRKRLDWEDLQRRLVITTDPERGFLREFAKRCGLDTLPVPGNVGGRFSVLSPVGLFPLSFLGVDVKEMLEGAALVRDVCLKKNLWENPAALLAALHYAHNERGKNIAVMMPYSERLHLFVNWWRQLWAESLGKEGKGQTPVKAVGTVDQHSQIQLYNDGPRDKIITFIVVERMQEDVKVPDGLGFDELDHFSGKTLKEVLDASYMGTASALVKNGVPVITLRIAEITPRVLGGLFMLYEVATAISGYLYGINPFDQPGVEEGKRLTHGLLGRRGFEQMGEEARKIGASCSKSLIKVAL